MEARARARLAAALALAPLVALVALALAGPIASGDLWWHVRTGEWILDHGELPERDPFSHTAGDAHWVLQEYGSQVLFALVLRAGGLVALRVFGVLLALLLVVAVYASARARLPAPWAALATALFALLFALKWELRPHLLSAFLVLRCAQLCAPRSGEPSGPRDWLEMLALAALWVQLHAEALFAPIAAAAVLAGALLGRALGEPRGARRAGAALALFAAALCGTLLSPLGLQPHRYVLFARRIAVRHIEEWFRPWVTPLDARFAPLTLAVFGAYVVCAGLGVAFVARSALARMRHRSAPDDASWERLGWLCACLALALQARRFLWLAWFPALELLALLVARRAGLARATAAPALAAALLCLPLARTLYFERALDALAEHRFGEPADRELFPVAACDFVADAGLAGNLFHRYEWGGYLGFRLREQNPVFIDGRTDLFERVIPERWAAERDPATAERVLAERDVRVIVLLRLVDHGAGPFAWQPPSEAWLRVWADALACVWIRADDEVNVARARASLERAGIALDQSVGFLEAQALAVRPEWLDQRNLLPSELRERLRPLLSSAASRARGRVFLDARMRKNARFEAQRWIDEQADAGERERLGALLEQPGGLALVLCATESSD